MDGTRVAVIVEDDRDIRELIEVVLRQAGFEIHVATSGESGVEAVREKSPAIVTLDLGLPDIDGFEVARQIRRFSDSYIIMLSARAEELDTLMGLESGADDYLTKPFRPRELRARVAAMMRRPRTGSGRVHAQTWPAATDSSPGDAAGTDTAAGVMGGDEGRGQQPHRPGVGTLEVAGFQHNGLMLDPGTRAVRVDGADLELTRTEFDLLHALLRGGPTVRTKSDLVRWLRAGEHDHGGYISPADERAIEVHIGNLRRKLGDDPRGPRWLKTIRGVGYCLAPART
ncbi:response regulator transcription factor [Arthrobacter pigmenti]